MFNGGKSMFIIVVIALCFSLAFGCGGADQTKEKAKAKSGAEVTYIEDKSTVSQAKADGAKKEVATIKEVKKVRGASVDNDIYLALTVEGFDRFFLERIRSDAQKKVSNKYPKENVHITTDSKISSDLEKLEKKLSKDGVKKADLKTDLKEVEDDMKG
ncbi:YhcN/YlaJ family sporulation lipoprotein [Alteribacter aurantiacus]|uniref:YhcN/YlaJ family sporulation lipoprotein n=1 Tax=Alteribacter aurantiacus TaxID=254410 RepID=UPI000405F51B|nr:YhcN/YlaJ family sporulation lipoprotein [Alteribacter aurantiacus]